ncbi:MAG TPA: response regulator [Caldithrix abyssi]|uniref:Response regulator n=1 Tax=Caldithrix abyssi TaxID=187145 RepID=A0A7V4TYT2_CALAY|nr:response regulator [Caldithrix abyssi]
MKIGETLEKELIHLGLLDKTREIYLELGLDAAISYIKSSYHLLSKVYHPDVNPRNAHKAKQVQQRLNHVSQLMKQVRESEFEQILRKGLPKKQHKKTRILIVEDEFGLQETLRDVFLMEGYDVRVAVDGDEGLQVFQKFNPDLIFTDVVMPKLNGLDMIKEIRKTDPTIKVIYVSGFWGIKRLKRQLDEEMLRYQYRYLTKPFKISAMLEMVADYLDDRMGIDITV